MKYINLWLFFVLLTVSSCSDTEKDKLYERPDWLKETLYQQLKTEPNFQFYSKALELTGYSEKLGKTGSYTVFVPTDEAFKAFLKENGGSLEQVDAEVLRQIVEYSIIDFPLTRDVLTARSEWGYWSKTDFSAFKKKTYYSLPLHREGEYTVISQLKFLPIYSKEYFGTIGLSGQDEATYNYFFPTRSWNKYGFDVNVLDANVVSIENPAENGFYYAVDKVLLPLNNIAEELKVNNKATEIRKLFDYFTEYVYNDYATTSANSTIKLYNKKVVGIRPVEFANPTFDLEIDINEELVKSTYSDQAPMYASHTIFVPSNDKVLEHLAKYDGAPSRPAMRHLINNHFIKEVPQYPLHLMKEASPYKFIFDQNLVDSRKIASNGVIYFIKTLLEPNVFKGVTAPVFFKEKYSKYMYALEKADQTLQLSDGTTNYHLLTFDNETLSDMGIEYNPGTDVFLKNGATWATSTNPKATSKDSVRTFVERHIVKGALKGGYAKTLAGDYVKVDVENNQVITDGKVVPVKTKIQAENGTGYMLQIESPLPFQQRNDDYLKANHPKFYNLLNRLGVVYLYDDYTAFVFPEDQITYGKAPFDMLNSSGAINTAVPNAAQRLSDLMNYHLATEPLFTTDESAYGAVKMKNASYIQFNGATIKDGAGNSVNIQTGNLTKQNGVVIHLIDKIMKSN